MRYGYWLPVFGGWLRNVEDENMAATWDYARRLTVRAGQIGFDQRFLKKQVSNATCSLQTLQD